MENINGIDKIDKRILKTHNKIKEKNSLLSLIWLNENDFFDNYKKLKKSLKLRLKCQKCNYIFERSIWSHLDKKNYRCPNCAGNLKLTFEAFLERFIKKRLNKYFWLKVDKNWWKENYKNTSTKIILKCKKCKNTINIDVNNLLYQNVKCKYCANEKRSLKNQKITYENFIEKAKEIHDKYDYSLITKEWFKKNFKGHRRSTKIKIPVICKKHGVFYTTYSKHIHQRSGCPKCYSSKGEQKIINYLKKKNIEYIYQYKIKNYNLDYNLRFDFYLPKYKLIIEYDGLQHFQCIEYFGKENYLKTIKNDILKQSICKAFGIKLLRIPYKDFDVIEKRISEFLKDLIIS